MMPLWIFDAILAAGLVLVAIGSLSAQKLFTAIVLFIAFGLLMALAWARLDAADIALVEAAIGAGLTGALLLSALDHYTGMKATRTHRRPGPANRPPVFRPYGRFAAALGCTALGALLALALWEMPIPTAEGAGVEILHAMAAHPVSHAVTAVLLDFRAYDTFLEMLVLALAGLGVLQLATATQVGTSPDRLTPSQVQRHLAGQLAPFMLLVAIYLYWAGTARPGGAFPAGTVLAAAVILVFLSDSRSRWGRDNMATRAALALGAAAFLCAGMASVLVGGAFMQWREAHAYWTILLLEGALTVAIAATLSLLYTAGSPAQPVRRNTAPPTPQEHR